MWKLNRDKCSSCGECVECCPCRALEMDGGFPQLKPDAKCIQCWTCADSCPKEAIELAIDKTILENT